MARRSRTRLVLKWTGLVICVLLLLVAGASIRWSLAWVRQAGDLGAGASGGVAWLGWRETKLPQKNTLANWSRPGLSVPVTNRAFRFDFSFSLRSWLTWRVFPKIGTVFGVRYVPAPLIVPFLVIGLPTAFLWYRDRRRIPPGHCQHCGYNLTGNVSGVCPECGRKV